MKLVQNNIPKIGRNDPCRCGSGIKFKKCCLGKDHKSLKSFDPIAFKGDMDQMVRQLGKIAEGKNLSVEKFNEYFVGKDMDPIAKEHEEIAQDMIYEAMEMKTGKERRAKLHKALSIYPNLADAWIMLAEEETSTPKEALEYYKKAIEAGEKDLGEEFFKENEGHFWGIIESRPYMRAKALLAQTLWDLGFEDESIGHYKECLRLNPNDNMGVRDVLTAQLLIKNDLKGVEAIQKRYREDFFSHYCYNRALFLFKKYGPTSKMADTQLDKAMERNAFVPAYLLGTVKMPTQIPISYAVGSKEEAIIYTDKSLRAWRETPDALNWLERQNKGKKMKKTFDLESMSEGDLLALNREIIRRIEIYRSIRNQSQLMAFRVGDRVDFETELGPIQGTVIRINQKTVSVEADDGRSWRIPPRMLSKAGGKIKIQENLLSISKEDFHGK